MTSLLSELSKIENEWKETEYAVYRYTPNRYALGVLVYHGGVEMFCWECSL